MCFSNLLIVKYCVNTFTLTMTSSKKLILTSSDIGAHISVRIKESLQQIASVTTSGHRI